MIIFHATYDLALFRLIPPDTPVTGAWPVFARLIAGSFLFLAGFSLWLAHGRGVRWRAFLRRLAVIVAAAAAVSLGTFFAMGESFVRFGILHSIALCSLFGLALLRLPVVGLVVLAVMAFVAPMFWKSEDLAQPYLLWLGLGRPVPMMVDYVPILPWLGPYLSGMIAARILAATGHLDRLSFNAPPWLGWPGRHSLAIYLGHQPILFGLIWAFVQMRG
jgi:uncharacterized membrane protein